MPRKYVPAFAVVRIDDFQGSNVPPEERITVKEIVATQGQAEEEVARLMRLNSEKGYRYVWQPTRILQSLDVSSTARGEDVR